MRRIWEWLGFHVHDWGKWADGGELVRCADNSVVGGIQVRVCATCNKHDYARHWY